MHRLSENYRIFIRTFTSPDPMIREIESVLSDKTPDIKAIRALVSDKKMQSPHHKGQALDYLVAYANFILEDGVISGEELNDFEVLKLVFGIREGDFMKIKSFQVREILKKQFLSMYSDDYIDKKEALEHVSLKIMFGLSYDAFEELKEDDVIASLLRGARPENLDIAKIPKNFRW